MNDPQPYLSHNFNRYSTAEWIEAGNDLNVFFSPRPGYSQDIEDYQ